MIEGDLEIAGGKFIGKDLLDRLRQFMQIYFRNGERQARKIIMTLLLLSLELEKGSLKEDWG